MTTFAALADELEAMDIGPARDAFEHALALVLDATARPEVRVWPVVAELRRRERMVTLRATESDFSGLNLMQWGQMVGCLDELRRAVSEACA